MATVSTASRRAGTGDVRERKHAWAPVCLGGRCRTSSKTPMLAVETAADLRASLVLSLPRFSAASPAPAPTFVFERSTGIPAAMPLEDASFAPSSLGTFALRAPSARFVSLPAALAWFRICCRAFFATRARFACLACVHGSSRPSSPSLISTMGQASGPLSFLW
eukprot:scaffold149_cov315-Pinguiococcus_pyrenoidosus.AAC.50